jgi:hypothetical protein
MATTSLDVHAMGELAERLVADPPMPTGQPARDELWPVVTARSSLYLTRNGGDFVDAPGGAGLNLTAAFDPRQVGTGRFSGSVLRALLYAHGLVIEDPLVMAADMYLSVPTELRHVARAGIETAVTNLVEIEHLLDANVVETYFRVVSHQGGRSSDCDTHRATPCRTLALLRDGERVGDVRGRLHRWS